MTNEDWPGLGRPTGPQRWTTETPVPSPRPSAPTTRAEADRAPAPPVAAPPARGRAARHRRG
ncbi:hypothetical protein ACFSBI_16185, partial [Amnibacterium endophyticum]